MNLLLQIALASLSLIAPQAPAKWRVVLPSGHVVVAPSRQLAAERAARLAGYDDVQAPEPTLDGLAPSAQRRHVEEASAELLARLDALEAEAQSDDAGAKAVALEALHRYQASKGPAADVVRTLNADLEAAATEQVTAEIGQGQSPSPIASAHLLGESTPLSDLGPIPGALQPGYVALLERLEGLRPFTSPQAPTYKRDQRLRSLLPQNASVRMMALADKGANGLRLSITLVARKGNDRTVAILSDHWIAKKGVYVLVGTSAIPASAPDLASMATQRIVSKAKAEVASIEQRHEKQRLAAEQKLKERDEEARLERERQQNEQERIAEEERKAREEQDRKVAEERKQQLEQYRRDLDDTVRDLDSARRDLQSSEQERSRARDDKRNAERDADQARQHRDEIAGRLRDAEQRLEDAKREGKGTQALESIVSELKDQLGGAERDYNQAHDRVDDAERRIQSLESTMGNLESTIRRLSSEADDLRNKISQLGG